MGGFDLAAEWMGWENVFHCEWNEFGQKVLKHYWPKAESFQDITKTDFTPYANKIDILTGGFPCQPYSMAGKRKGKDDERHLWPEMLRAIREIQPRWVVGENVLGLVNWNGGLVFHEVQTDLEAAGYEVWPYVLPAVSVNAPHRRDRVWFVAKNTMCNGFVFGEPNQEEAEIRKFRNTCTRGSDGVYLSERPTSNTNNTGNTSPGIGNNGNGQKESSQWEYSQFEFSRSCNEGAITNANGVRLQQCEDTGEVGRGQAEMGGQGSEFTNAIETNGEAENVTHPNGNGFNERNGEHEINASEGWFNALGNADTGNEYGDATDTDLQRYDKFKFTPITNKPERFNSQKNIIGEPGGWQNFPTQSPICSRNDGLSSRLDGITFSKWRNESIKAAGNAIVPQVVYQIFKAIEQYENLK
jgi:DNA (cytosine-5)-methyltransferase 1